MKWKKEDYFPVRVLDESPVFFHSEIGKKLSDVLYYFADIYQISS